MILNRFSAIALILVAIVVLIWGATAPTEPVVPQSYSAQIHCNDTSAQQRDANRTHSRTFDCTTNAAEREHQTASNEQPIRRWIRDLVADPVALFTLVLSLSTIFLWWETKQAREGLERDQRIVERAYIYIGPNLSKVSAEDKRALLLGHPITVPLHTVNAGKTPGIIREVYCEFIPNGDDPTEPVPSYSDPNCLVSMNSVYGGGQQSDPTWKNPVTSNVFVAFGYVKYVDAFGDKHESRFCARLRVSDGAFNVIGPDAWNADT